MTAQEKKSRLATIVRKLQKAVDRNYISSLLEEYEQVLKEGIAFNYTTDDERSAAIQLVKAFWDELPVGQVRRTLKGQAKNNGAMAVICYFVKHHNLKVGFDNSYTIKSK